MLANRISEFPGQVDTLKKAIQDNPSSVIREGGVIAEGYDPELDELRNLNRNAGQYLVDLEIKEKENNLDVKHPDNSKPSYMRAFFVINTSCKINKELI